MRLCLNGLSHKRSQSADPVCVCALESKECESKKLGVLCLLSVGKDRGILEGSLTSLSLCLSCSDTFLWCIMVKPREIKLHWY